jgi:membrane protein implicated in regulation of membrane protease activity
MAQSTIWWVLAGTVIALELATGTFYFLMLSTGLVAAAIAAHLGLGTSSQVALAAVVGGASIVVWRAYKKWQPASAPASANRDVNLDIGETVRVESWTPDGTSTVRYRGAQWSVSLLAGATPSPGNYTIIEVVGSKLIVKKSQ